MKNLLNYFLGYVTILIKGDHVERFINLALQRGIRIWDIQGKKDGSVKAQVQLSHIKPLRHAARKSRTTFRIVGRLGLPFRIKALKRRKILALGGFLFVAALYVLSSFVFFVEVTSPQVMKNVHPVTIERLAREKGIAPGRPKWLMNFRETEKYLMAQVPQLSWVSISAQGTRVEIEIVEKVLPEPGEKDKSPGHVTALKDGVVTEVLVIRGRPLVEPGMTVSRGDILISGLIEAPGPEAGQHPGPEEDGPEKAVQQEMVKADGIVRARVWYRGYGECAVKEEERSFTGEKKRYVLIKWGEKTIQLWGDEKSPYPLSRTEKEMKTLSLGEKRAPVEIHMTTYREEKINLIHWGAEGALNQAVKKAILTAKRDMALEGRTLNQEIRELPQGKDGVKRVFVMIEREEAIGKFLSIE